MIWTWLVLFSFTSAVLYRMGGCDPVALRVEWGWVPKWIRKFPKKRDVGCNLVCLAGAFIVGLRAPWWAWVIAFGLTWASLSTYWDFMFGYDNHWFHGFMIGMSLMPIAYTLAPVILLIAFVLAILMGGYSKIVTNATWEELGRGFVMPISLALVLCV